MACEYSFADKTAFDNYIKQLEELRDFFTARGEQVVPLPGDGIVFYNDELGVAGTPDLITVDENGQYRIYDLKTKKTGRFTEKNKSGEIMGMGAFKKGEMSNRVKYSRQMSMYNILAHNTHGIEFVEAKVIPLEAERTDTNVDYSVKGTKFILTDEAMEAKLYPSLLPVVDKKVQYDEDPIAQLSEESPTDPPPSPKPVAPKTVQQASQITNDRGMQTKPAGQTASSLVVVGEDGSPLGPFTLESVPVVGPQTIEGVPIEEKRYLLESPEEGAVGSSITLRGIVTDQYKQAFEENNESAYALLPIYIYNEQEEIIGRVPSFDVTNYKNNNAGLVKFRAEFYEAFREDQNHSVSATVAAKKVQTSSNINNARTSEGETFFYTLAQAFSNTYHYDANLKLKFGDAPLILLSMRGPTRSTMRWNYKTGELETLSDKQLAKLDVDLTDTEPRTLDSLRAGQLGVAIVDPVTGKYKVVPVTTRTLTENAVERVVNAFLDNDLETVHLIVGANKLEDENTGNNSTFLKFATFQRRGDQTIYDQDGKEITTLADMLEANFGEKNEDYETIQEQYRALKEEEKDFVVYFYSDTKAGIANGEGIVRMTAEDLRAAMNGEEFSFSSVSLQTNKSNQTKFRGDKALQNEEDAEAVRAAIVDDFKALLGRKRFQVDTALSGRTNSFFVKGFTSPLTGNQYGTYLEYLNSQTEGLGAPQDGKGAESILITDILNDNGALHHDIGLDITTEELAPAEVEEEAAVISAPERSETAEVEDEVGGTLLEDDPFADLAPGEAPFRVGEETPTQRIQRENAVEYLESRFPGFGVTIFDKARQVGGGLAHGWFENMAFHVWSNAEVGTEYHEAFHGMFRMFLTNEQRNSLYKQAGAQFTEEDVAAKTKELRGIYSTITAEEARELALEELMAEGFRNYVITEEQDKGGFGKAILDFFKDLYLFIKATVTDNLTMGQVFRIANARTGTILGRTKAKMLRNSDKFITENSDVNRPYAYKRGLSDAQVKAVSGQITKHALDQLDAAEETLPNQMGNYGSIPMYYLSRSMSIEENGVLVPLPMELAREFKRLYKDGGAAAVKPLIRTRGIRPIPPAELKARNTATQNTIRHIFMDIGLNWEDSLDNSEFRNIEARGWSHFVREDLAKRNVKTKFQGIEEITLDENEDTVLDRIFNLASEEVDHRKKLSAQIKGIISRVEDPIPNFLGFKVYLDPNEVYRMIIANAINSRSYQEFVGNLEYGGRGIPALANVASAIEGLTIQEKALLRTGFTLAANEFFTIRKRLNVNEYGEVRSVSYAMFNPDRRSQITDGMIRTKNRVYKEAGENPRAIYDVRVNKSTTAKEYFPVSENVAKVDDAYEKFTELYNDRATDVVKLSRAAADVLYNLGIWYGVNKGEHTSNFVKVIRSGMKFAGQEVSGRNAIAALFYGPRGTAVNIELLIDGIRVAGKSVFETESSTLSHLMSPLEVLNVPFTNSFVDNGKSKYPVNTPHGYNDAEYLVQSGRLAEMLNEDEIFTPHERVKTLFAYLLDRAAFRNNYKITQFSSYSDDTSFEGMGFKERGGRTALVVALNAFLNQGSMEYAKLQLPTPGDKQSARFQQVPRLGSKLLQQFSKRDILENMLLAELSKIDVAKTKVEDAIYNLEDKTDEEIAAGLAELIIPFHLPASVEVDYSKPRQAAEALRKAREEGEVGTGENLSIFDVLDDEDVLGGKMSDYVSEYISHKVGETSALNAEQIAAFEEKLGEMLNSLEIYIATETDKVFDKFADLGINRNSIDTDAFDKAENYASFEEVVEDFVFSDMVYRAEFAKAFRGGIDFAGDPVKFYKRMSTMGTPGSLLTMQSELEEEDKQGIEDYGMLDEYNTASFYDLGWAGEKADVDQYLKDVTAVANAIGGEIGAVVKEAYQPNNIEGVDGTTFISMKMYRHIRMGEGRWFPEDEAAYKKYKETGKYSRPLYILKPLYDGAPLLNSKITPYVDKTAFVPLTAELTQSRPVLDELRKRMEAVDEYSNLPEVHVVAAVSAQKLSRKGTIPVNVSNLEATKGSLTGAPITTVPGNHLRIVQPTVEVEKNKIKIQRQFRKNVIANINMDGQYSLAGNNATGKQLFDLFHGAIENKIRKSLNSFMNNLGFNAMREAIEAQDREALIEAKSRFFRQFQRVLREEIEERGLNRNYEDAIKMVADQFQGVAFSTPLSFPTLERKFENIFYSLFKSRVLSQKVNGIEVPQVAELGGAITDKGVEKLKFTRLDGDKVIAAEAAVSAKMLKKMGAKVGDEVVGFRVPNQGMSSMIVFKIARVLPDSYEKAIMVPTPITKLMGSDFDIDKMFLMFSESSKKSQVDYKKLLSGALDTSKLNNAQLTNLMLDVSKAILLNRGHLQETQRPLDSPLLSDIRDKLLEVAPQVRLETDPETGKEIVRFNSILTEIEMEMRNKLGIAKRGSYANVIAGRNVGVHGDLIINPDKAPDINGEIYNGITQEKSRIPAQALDFIRNTIGIDILGEEFTDYYISLYLSAAVDAAKDPLQHYLNDTPATTRAIALMLSVGVDPVTISLLLNQPGVRAVTERYAEREATPNQLAAIAQEVVEEKYDEALPKEIVSIPTTTQALYESIDESRFIDEKTDSLTPDHVKTQLDAVQNFLAFSAAGGELTRAYKVITPDNASNVGQSAGVQAYMDAHDSFVYEINQENYVEGVSNILLEDSYPFAKMYVDAYRSILDASGFLFNSFSPAAFYFKDRIKLLTGNAALTEAQHNLVNRAINYHLLTSEGSPLAALLDKNEINKRYFSVVGEEINDEGELEEVIDRTKGIMAIWDALGEVYPKLADTKLYKAIQPDVEYLTTQDQKSNFFSYLVMADKPRDAEEANDMVSEFEDLLFNPEVFIGEEVAVEQREKAKEDLISAGEMLIQNAMITKGFSLGANSYSELIPARWLEASGTSEFFRQKELELDEQNALDGFAFDFMRQFGTSIAPAINSEKTQGNPLHIQISKSDGTYDSARGQFSTFAKAADALNGTSLYIFQSLKKKGRTVEAVYTRVMQKGRPGKLIEHNLRENGKIENDKSLIRLGDMEVTGKYSFLGNKQIQKALTDFSYLEDKLGLPIGGVRKGSTATKKC